MESIKKSLISISYTNINSEFIYEYNFNINKDFNCIKISESIINEISNIILSHNLYFKLEVGYNIYKYIESFKELKKENYYICGLKIILNKNLDKNNLSFYKN